MVDFKFEIVGKMRSMLAEVMKFAYLIRIWSLILWPVKSCALRLLHRIVNKNSLVMCMLLIVQLSYLFALQSSSCTIFSLLPVLIKVNKMLYIDKC